MRFVQFSKKYSGLKGLIIYHKEGGAWVTTLLGVQDYKKVKFSMYSIVANGKGLRSGYQSIGVVGIIITFSEQLNVKCSTRSGNHLLVFSVRFRRKIVLIFDWANNLITKTKVRSSIFKTMLFY